MAGGSVRPGGSQLMLSFLTTCLSTFDLPTCRLFSSLSISHIFLAGQTGRVVAALHGGESSTSERCLIRDFGGDRMDLALLHSGWEFIIHTEPDMA